MSTSILAVDDLILGPGICLSSALMWIYTVCLYLYPLNL